MSWVQRVSISHKEVSLISQLLPNKLLKKEELRYANGLKKKYLLSTQTRLYLE
ncbi:MAG: hypothetical protein ACI936_001939 [Paraglaciecola sp.]|jgi:hypothetical protein